MAIEITINTDVTKEVLALRQQIVDQIVQNNNPILLVAASSVLALVAHRIHTEGEKANGSKIGSYSNSYMKVRQSGKYNRNADRTMIFSLTRQMENDFTVVEENGGVGLGFKNAHNADKARWLEEKFPGTYLLNVGENKVVVDVINEYINGIFA